MIIVNQDKNMLVNFNNVESMNIFADLDGTGEIPFKIYFETTSSREELGKYRTEERAKEVLKEIVDTYIKIGIVFKMYNGAEQQVLPVYEMPEE